MRDMYRIIITVEGSVMYEEVRVGSTVALMRAGVDDTDVAAGAGVGGAGSSC